MVICQLWFDSFLFSGIPKKGKFLVKLTSRIFEKRTFFHLSKDQTVQAQKLIITLGFLLNATLF